MKSSFKSLTAIIALLPLFSFFACYDEQQVIDPVVAEYGLETPSIDNVYPANGESNVNRHGALGIKFNRPMDTASVNRSMRVVGASGIQTCMDSLMQRNDSTGGGQMGNPPDDHTMDWIDSVSYTGAMHWNATSDSCVFHADSAFLPNTEHMIILTGEIRAHDGTAMDMSGYDAGCYMSFFTTGP
ncbi:MAG: Ig-like domain-containing protein [Candidatus Zixiibacteriota bacterium]